MHLHRLYLKDFRNLRDFEIQFDQFPENKEPSACKDAFKSHAVIGQNGSGKSNLIEALVTIFRDLDLDAKAQLDYEIDYTIQDYEVRIKAEDGRTPQILVNGDKVSAKRLSENGDTYLPAHIFAYYSGKNNRIEELFQRHIDRFRERMENVEEEFLPAELLESFTGTEEEAQAIEEHRKRSTSKRKSLGKDLLRRLFYCRNSHTQLVLLACLLSDDDVFKKVLSDLNIVELDSALFVLKKPHRQKKLDEKDILHGDNRFWFSRGNVVSEFLDKLWEVATAPIDHREKKLIDFRGRREWQDQIYLFVSDKDKLQKLGEKVGDYRQFFRYAEGAYIGDFIDEVRITVKHRDADGNISFDYLSEGELQLLTVIGLMRLTSQDDCLFLLDEPDTHLNPIWKLRYFDEIEEAIQPKEGAILTGQSQIIITTHDPIMVGSLDREQVRILKNENGLSLRNERGNSIVETPNEHPRGMGVSGLLKSDMFGLPSTLDRHTLERIHTRNELLAKRAKGSLSPTEETKLNELKDYLDDLGFSSNYQDPWYQLFIEKMYEARQLPFDQLFSKEEQAAQEALAKKIVREQLRQEKFAELSEIAEGLQIKHEGWK